MGKIDYEELKKIKMEINNGSIDEKKIQYNHISLNKDIGELGVGVDAQQFSQANIYFDNPLDKYKSYALNKIHLVGDEESRVLKNAGPGINYELVIELYNTGNVNEKLFIIFLIQEMTSSIMNDESVNALELEQIISNGVSTQAKQSINLDNLINKENNAAFYLKGRKDTVTTDENQYIIYEEPIFIKTGAIRTVTVQNLLSQNLNYGVENLTYEKYYNGGSYYQECIEYEVGDDKGEKKNISVPNVESPSIDINQYMPYIIGILSGIFLIVLIFSMFGGVLSMVGKLYRSVINKISSISKKEEAAGEDAAGEDAAGEDAAGEDASI